MADRQSPVYTIQILSDIAIDVDHALKDNSRISFQGRSTMLVLTRKLHAGLVIDDPITVTVVKLGDRQVRLGIEAPRKVPVRHEARSMRLPRMARKTRQGMRHGGWP